MKKLLFNLLFLISCTTDENFKTIKTKYVPNDCAKLTEEFVKEASSTERSMLSKINFVIIGLTAESYVIIQIHPVIGPMPPQPENISKFNIDTQPTECPEIVKKALQQQEQTQEDLTNESQKIK